MSGWTAKRFWTQAQAIPVAEGYSVVLDGRGVKTPAKADLVVPTLAMAEAIAAEWQAQQGRIDPATMPFTRSANAAIDKVGPQFAEVAAMIAAYGDTDLLCYRADAPERLVAWQSDAWDPLLDWAATDLGARLTPIIGVIHRPQDPSSLRVLTGHVSALSPFELTAFHDLVALSGSLIIGFAAIRGHLPLATLWDRSRIDEHWQAELWGTDDEAAEMEAQKRGAFLHAGHFHRLCLPPA
ncbi:MAG: ATPase [Paracoccaceae bacterium]|nr:ATPase [Paracoccaceae bacterium]